MRSPTVFLGASPAPLQPVATSGRVRNAPAPKNLDPLAGSDEEGGYPAPSEIALPESPVVETTSGSDSAVLVSYAGCKITVFNCVPNSHNSLNNVHYSVSLGYTKECPTSV